VNKIANFFGSKYWYCTLTAFCSWQHSHWPVTKKLDSVSVLVVFRHVQWQTNQSCLRLIIYII